jgi:hypothetical protein
MNEILTFSQALDLLKNGRSLCRNGWNGKGMYIFVILGADPSKGIEGWMFNNGRNDNNKELLPFIAMKTADDKVVPWLASQTDILAEDWQEASNL